MPFVIIPDLLLAGACVLFQRDETVCGFHIADALRPSALQIFPIHLERFCDNTVGHVLLHVSCEAASGDVVLHSAQSAVNGRLDRHRQKRLVVLYGDFSYNIAIKTYKYMSPFSFVLAVFENGLLCNLPE